MKIRNGFVSNSSSSSFMIHNNSDQCKSLVDFVMENKYLLDKFNEDYESDEKLSDMVKDAECANETFDAHTGKNIIFGDEDGTTIGRVYDYILRDGGKSESFSWYQTGSLR
jgi:hypothetical protein